MAGRHRSDSERWWRAQGYRAEPGTHRQRTDPTTARLAIKDDSVDPADIPMTYYPTRSSNPADPRTSAMGYDKSTRTMVVEWGDGGNSYYYKDVTPGEWANMKRVASPGRAINRTFNSKEYGPIG